jgi:phenylalanine ammonia-lyase
MMLIRCNSLMKGHSGVLIHVIETILKLLAPDMTPVVPLRGSISASGDLSTLSYITGAIEGNPDVFIRVVARLVLQSIRQVMRPLDVAGLDRIGLQVKEGLGVTSGTAASYAAARIVIHQANQLAVLIQPLTVMSTEALWTATT